MAVVDQRGRAFSWPQAPPPGAGTGRGLASSVPSLPLTRHARPYERVRGGGAAPGLSKATRSQNCHDADTYSDRSGAVVVMRWRHTQRVAHGAIPMFAKMLGVLLALSFAPATAMAQQAYVDIEQRLTAEQRHATGLDKLSLAQLELLNRLLREESLLREASASVEPAKAAN